MAEAALTENTLHGWEGTVNHNGVAIPVAIVNALGMGFPESPSPPINAIWAAAKKLGLTLAPSDLAASLEVKHLKAFAGYWIHIASEPDDAGERTMVSDKGELTKSPHNLAALHSTRAHWLFVKLPDTTKKPDGDVPPAVPPAAE